MLQPTHGVNRMIRTATLAGTCVLITVTGHGAASGHVSLLGIGLLAVLMALLAGFATSRELTFGQLLSFAAIAQVGAHVLLSFLAPIPGAHAMPSVSASLGGHHGGLTAPGTGFDLPVAMIAVHALLCVAMAGLLRHGEQLFFRLHRTLPAIFRVMLGTAIARTVDVLPVPRPRFAGFADDAPLPTLDLIRDQIARRGPPAC